MARNVDSTTSFDDLPLEAAEEIFTRLPVKTLIRSTSVCKTWYSNITNPTFTSAHIQHSLSCCDETAVLIIPSKYKNNKSCSLISARTGHVLKTYTIPFTTNAGMIKLVASLNGILCLAECPLDNFGRPAADEFQELYLWNPSVGKYKALFSSCFKRRGKCSYAVGLGFLEGSCDFRVVRVAFCKDDVGCLLGKVAPKVEVYSLKTNKWRRIRNPVVPRVARDSGKTVGNSMTYWLDRDPEKLYSCSEEGYIVYFDFNREVFGQIELPDDVRNCVGLMATFKLMTFESKLAVFVFNDVQESNGLKLMPSCIWLLSHEDGKFSWTPRFKVVLGEHVFPFSLSRSGALIVLSACPPVPGLVSCNLKSQDLRLTKPLVTDPCSVDTAFVESLLMLEGRDEQKNS
ncbi:hypothetical protein DCAR_0103473 [Daucus carota subsp. sativus]|uniref:F-box domain-containing protein n=2 Tax=Daucus carota subsp. sativus TaxID=79200 RepID=A0AAF0W6T3_DAUCS|nr:PREDICTED: F-box/kelch-repeat protein At3g17530-like [Daucus carota subsp. sativus]WOG84290.1 hypothetical protein DCAR_0103473 [Daucus carota subsp. sativus]